MLNQLDFNYIKAKINTKFKDKSGEKQSFTTNLRMKKDSAIWAVISKMNYPALTILITPDSVKFVNKLEKKYYVGAFSFINQQLQADITFQDLQNLLVGNVIAIDTNSKYYFLEKEQRKYLSNLTEEELSKMLENQFSTKKWVFNYLINNNYKASETSIYNPNKNSTLTLTQKDFQTIEGDIFPENTNASFISEQDSVEIELNYSKITKEETLTFPFTISDSYIPYGNE